MLFDIIIWFFKQPQFTWSYALVEYFCKRTGNNVCGQKVAHNFASFKGKYAHKSFPAELNSPLKDLKMLISEYFTFKILAAYLCEQKLHLRSFSSYHENEKRR